MEGVLQSVNSENLAVEKVWFEESYIFVKLMDQRVIGHPLVWYPHLEKGTEAQREKVEIWGDGKWLHWEELNEDLSSSGFLNFVKPQIL